MEHKQISNSKKWQPGSAPVAVIMISYNEAHNIDAVLDNLNGWAEEVFLVDSYSTDETVDMALKRGVKVVQRPFKGFGDQWNYAVSQLPISAKWTMKLDPDERLTEELKSSIQKHIEAGQYDAMEMDRCLWFMGKALPVRQRILRVWRSGTCKFTDVAVNEHPIVTGKICLANGDMQHHDSPTLHHWFEKQNKYTTSEATAIVEGGKLAFKPKLFGTPMERRMWLKKNFYRLPFRYFIMQLYCLFILGAWKSGRSGFIWARLRSEIHRMIEYKTLEMNQSGQAIELPSNPLGKPHPGAVQANSAKKE